MTAPLTDSATGVAGVPRRRPSRRRSRPPCGRPGRAAASCSSPTSPAGSATDWVETVRAVADAGADAIEIGIPFSDPVMDGPVIQEASRAGAAAGRHPAVGPRPSCAASTPASRSS